MEELGTLAKLEALFGKWVVDPIGAILFFDVAFWDNGSPNEIVVPVVVLWLIIGATLFTLYFRFINLRAFRHAIDCTRGRYTRPDDPGEISHFQALSAALSATVGLGNIAGVAVAVGIGGPGAVFWMVVAGFLGMSSKFVECTLGQMYRQRRSDGHISGGPMHYLRLGLAERGFPGLGRVLAVVFSFMCIGGSFGGGNMFQANQAYSQVASVLPIFSQAWGAPVFGVILALLVAVVIVGGIRRIGEVAGFLVPIMCVIYVLAGLSILLFNANQLGDAFAVILRSAFAADAAYGGFVGVLIQGFRRAAFSNEAGVGSAPIAHAAAATSEPVREGIVGLLEPFIDTMIVCMMTGLVLVVTGAYANPEAGSGINMTSYAFASVYPWFPYLLSLTAILFAFSTQISWSYYGERCWEYLFGERTTLIYKVLFLFFVWFGAVSQLDRVVEFSDLMILGMAFPNLAGVYFLLPKVRAKLNDYMERLRSGEIAPNQ